MKVLRDGHAGFEMGYQKERRCSSGEKVGPSAILFTGNNQEVSGFRSGVNLLLNLQANNLWFLVGQAVLIAAFIIGWRIVTEPGKGATLLQTPGFEKTGQSDAASRRGNEAQEMQVAGQNKRMAILTDSTNSRESHLIITAEKVLTSPIVQKQIASAEPVQINETLPSTTDEQKARNANLAPPSIPHTNSAATAKSGAVNVASTVHGTAAFRADHVPLARKRPADSMGMDDPWVINLVSSSSKADADRFEEKARSMNFITAQQQVTIKGHQYWRVQITGFATEKEARTYAGNARDKLGLKEVWIKRR